MKLFSSYNERQLYNPLRLSLSNSGEGVEDGVCLLILS